MSSLSPVSVRFPSSSTSSYSSRFLICKFNYFSLYFYFYWLPLGKSQLTTEQCSSSSFLVTHFKLLTLHCYAMLYCKTNNFVIFLQARHCIKASKSLRQQFLGLRIILDGGTLRGRHFGGK